ADTQHFAFYTAGEDRVGRLVAAKPYVPSLLGDPLRFDDLRRRERAASDHAHFALAHEVAHRTERLVDVGQRTVSVHLVQIDVVGSQAAQRIFAGSDDP